MIFKRFTPKYWAIALVNLVTVIHILLGTRLGLTVDAAHYALYGVHLDWSYFDHPPLVGWAQSLVLLLSHSNLALRVWAMIINILIAILLYVYAPKLAKNSSKWFGFNCVLAAEMMLILNLLGMVVIPQNFLLLFGFASLVQIYRIVHQQQRSVWQFALLGILLAAAALSEYTAIFVALSAAIFLTLEDKKLWLNWRWYLTILIAGVGALPVIYWNIEHHWIAFRYQTEHVAAGHHWHLSTLLISQAIQVLVYNPLAYLVMLLLWSKAWQQRSNSLYRWSFSLALPMTLAFVYSNGITIALPHWNALIWLVCIPLMVDFVMQRWHLMRWRISVGVAIAYSVVILLFVYIQGFFHILNFPLGRDPLIDLYGWQKAATVAVQKLESLPAAQKQGAKFFVPNWTLASRLSWYAKQPVQVLDTAKFTQFNLWYGTPNARSHGIVVVPYQWRNDFALGARAFHHCQYLNSVQYHIGKALVNQFKLYYCTGFKSN